MEGEVSWHQKQQQQQQQSEVRREEARQLAWSSNSIVGAVRQPAGWQVELAIAVLRLAGPERGRKRASIAETPHVTRSTTLQLLQGNAGVTAIIFMAGHEIIISYFA